MAIGDLQENISDLQGDDPPQTNVSAGDYSPPAVSGEILVGVAWLDQSDSPVLSGFALPSVVRIRVTAVTDAGGILDPAGIPLQVALSTTRMPVLAGLEWITATFDGATRFAEVAIPQDTPSGAYFVVWRAVMTENAPNDAAGLLQGLLTVE